MARTIKLIDPLFRHHSPRLQYPSFSPPCIYGLQDPLYKTLLLLIYVGISTGLLTAPEVAADEVAEDALWWTLTDEIASADLKAIHEDRVGHVERYMEAAESGVLAPKDEESLANVFYIAGETPDLMPFWWAFDAFAFRFDGSDISEAREKESRSMQRAGLSVSAAELIIARAMEYQTRSTALANELAPDVIALMEVTRAAGSEVGIKAAAANLERGDVQQLSLLTGTDPATLHRYISSWKRSPIEETMLEILPGLRQDLSSQEWQRLRAFFLHHVAPQISHLDLNHGS